MDKNKHSQTSESSHRKHKYLMTVDTIRQNDYMMLKNPNTYKGAHDEHGAQTIGQQTSLVTNRSGNRRVGAPYK